MTLKEHSKHAKLARPTGGNFGRNEWAIVGAPCNAIKLLADQIIRALSVQYKCAYADTSHVDEMASMSGRLAAGASCEFTDQLAYQQFVYSEPLTPIHFKQQFAGADIVLVNGNHQQAQAQVVVIHPDKRSSLQKRLDQLNSVQLILLSDDANEVFDFVKAAIPDWKKLPLYKLNDIENIVEFFRNKLSTVQPKLNGLVLAGGRSIRMGYDKGAMNWHGKAQRYHLADMLKAYCSDVFISCRKEQSANLGTDYQALVDTFIDLGPYGAILSAFRERPDDAWLVVACDLPLLDEATLSYLITNRNPSAVATAFQSEYNDFPEPLITIWEPKSYPVLLAYLAQGYSCPRKVLINSDTAILRVPDAKSLTNVNTLADIEAISNYVRPK